ncbi:trimeric intracellular cation channel family protein [Octadecabacter sp.]|nr:trimeric intracellular cation channel family protein [Octadecabacter sp.]
MTVVEILDLIAVFIFALTGALVASRAQLDLVGFVFIACLTAVGGGTVRDVILDRGVFWVREPSFVLVASMAALLVFFTAHFLESRLKAIFWLDAVALAVAVPAGVAAAINLGVDWPVVLIMGVATGCFGGLMRDVVCNEVPLVLKQGELYVTCALVGAGVAMILMQLDQPLTTALLACAGATFALRAGSLAFGWRLPVYKSRPPRS